MKQNRLKCYITDVISDSKAADKVSRGILLFKATAGIVTSILNRPLQTPSKSIPIDHSRSLYLHYTLITSVTGSDV